jgi:hypothetical protein
MTGPEHYETAERLLAHFTEHGDAISAVAAGVHTGLALAAATACLPYPGADPEWLRVAGDEPS